MFGSAAADAVFDVFSVELSSDWDNPSYKQREDFQASEIEI